MYRIDLLFNFLLFQHLLEINSEASGLDIYTLLSFKQLSTRLLVELKLQSPFRATFKACKTRDLQRSLAQRRVTGFWQELRKVFSLARTFLLQKPEEAISPMRVAAELLKKLKLVEVLQFEYQLQAASCNNCKQLDKALSLEQVESKQSYIGLQALISCKQLQSLDISCKQLHQARRQASSSLGRAETSSALLLRDSYAISREQLRYSLIIRIQLRYILRVLLRNTLECITT